MERHHEVDMFGWNTQMLFEVVEFLDVVRSMASRCSTVIERDIQESALRFHVESYPVTA